MQLAFDKYQACGNDFIIVDGSNLLQGIESQQIQACCNRYFGIGADGFIVLTQLEDEVLKMDYFNADGHPGSFCGNGARAAFRYAQSQHWVKHSAVLHAADGSHRAQYTTETDCIAISMQPVQRILKTDLGYELNTGSPHLIVFVENIHQYEVFDKGRQIRNSPKYLNEGINVNFVSHTNGDIFVRTYERGVEAETLSCGTGVTASALAVMHKNSATLQTHRIQVNTRGGTLYVSAQKTNEGYDAIELSGPAKWVFSGFINL
ncbi:MAG: diaminopimelate epimerase [Bacteroidia bacterium]|jgi:diaminopimelate epimerase